MTTVQAEVENFATQCVRSSPREGQFEQGLRPQAEAAWAGAAEVVPALSVLPATTVFPPLVGEIIGSGSSGI